MGSSMAMPFKTLGEIMTFFGAGVGAGSGGFPISGTVTTVPPVEFVPFPIGPPGPPPSKFRSVKCVGKPALTGRFGLSAVDISRR